MKNVIGVFLLIVGLVSSSLLGQTATFAKSDLNQSEIDAIVAKFTRNERLFRSALNVYAFKRDALIATIGMGGQITGTYKRDSHLTFDATGKRVEKILFAPISTLTEITLTQSDIENLGGLDPFAIEPAKIDSYKFTYLGKEKIDELDLYVFDVAPKVLPKSEKEGRLFQGRIWVDDRDFFIVKSRGKAVPEWKERFPEVETYRQNVDGKYWFPSFSTSDDELVFKNGRVVKLKFRVKYYDYNVGKTDVKIIGEEDVVEPAPAAPVKKP
jgi:hypothetical protein